MNASDNAKPPPGREVATLAGGCFWCLEAVYDQLKGVNGVESGYIGGRIPDPSYEQVCGGDTGHAEAVRITFDPKAVSYRDLLKVFFTMHDPTTLNRQGSDVGTQYRSAVFYHSPEQKRVVDETIAELTAESSTMDPSSPRLRPPAPSIRPRTTTRNTSSAIHTSPTVSTLWRPRWPSSASCISTA